MISAAQKRVLVLQIEEAVREIGVLLLAFSPLDAVAWQDMPNRRALVLLFLGVAALFFGGATISAVRRAHGAD